MLEALALYVPWKYFSLFVRNTITGRKLITFCLGRDVSCEQKSN